MDKQKAAYLLYQEDWDQKRIAKTFGVTESTVHNWKVKYNWKHKKTINSIARETAEESLWELINYQLEVLKEQKEKWLRGGDKKLIDKGDIDALTKMFSSVKGKQLEWTNYVKICRELVDYIRGHDIELAKSILDQVDDFLNAKRKEL